MKQYLEVIVHNIFKQTATIMLQIHLEQESSAMSYLSLRLHSVLPETVNKDNLQSIIAQERQITLKSLLEQVNPIEILLKSPEIQASQTNYTQVWQTIMNNRTSKMNLLMKYVNYARDSLAQTIQNATESDIKTEVTNMLSRNYQTIKRLDEVELELSLEEVIAQSGHQFFSEWLGNIFSKEIGIMLNAQSLRNAHVFPIIAHNIAKKLDSSRSNTSYLRIDAPAHMINLFSAKFVFFGMEKRPKLKRKSIINNLADAIENYNQKKTLKR